MSNLHTVKGKNTDELVINAVDFVLEYGSNLQARSGSGLQVANVNYVLINPRDRLHFLRQPTSIDYQKQEFLMYFQGTRKAADMEKISKLWGRIADENGNINSNYGYYTFHQKTPTGSSQFERCLELFNKNPQTRRAFISILQLEHQNETKDYPCTIGCQFFIKNGYLEAIINSRSCDIITGLPYDIGFFSLVQEMMFVSLKQMGFDLKLGSCTLHTNFTQLYYSRKELLKQIMNQRTKNLDRYLMPAADEKLLQDIKNQTADSNIVKWSQNKQYSLVPLFVGNLSK